MPPSTSVFLPPQCTTYLKNPASSKITCTWLARLDRPWTPTPIRPARNWDDLLTARARELRPGGRLVMLNFGIDEEGRYLGNTGGVNMFDTFSACGKKWQATRQDHRSRVHRYCLSAVLPNDRGVLRASSGRKLRAVSSGPCLVSAKPVWSAAPTVERSKSPQALCRPESSPVITSPRCDPGWEAVFLNGLSSERSPERKRQSSTRFISVTRTTSLAIPTVMLWTMSIAISDRKVE